MSDLLALLRTDLGDEDAALFDETTLTRCLHRAAFVLGRDLDTAFAIQAGEIVPAPEEYQPLATTMWPQSLPLACCGCARAGT